MSEATDQAALFAWIDLVTPREPRLALAFHPANGGKRDKRTAALLAAQGVRRGVPDIMLPCAARGFHGCAIELKAERGRLSADQVVWIERLNAAGWFAGPYVGWVPAALALCWYLGRAPEEMGL